MAKLPTIIQFSLPRSMFLLLRKAVEAYTPDGPAEVRTLSALFDLFGWQDSDGSWVEIPEFTEVPDEGEDEARPDTTPPQA